MQVLVMVRTTLLAAIAAAGMAGFPAAARGQSSAPPDYLITRPSSFAFDETVSRVKQAIEAENLMVVHEINPQQMLRMVGVRTNGMRQILFFHPRFMKTIIETNRNGGIEPPLKILIMESNDGRVMVRYEDPVRQFETYSGLRELADELRGILEAVVSTVSP